MKKPVTMAAETVARADNVLVRVESDDGFVGWGEAAAAPTMTGETVASMMAALAHMAPVLLGRPADDFAEASAAMDAAMYGNTGAKAAIEIALHDLVGRATGRPLYALFGARQRSRLPVLAVIGSTDAAADLREARGALGRRLSRLQDQGRTCARRRRTARARGPFAACSRRAARNVSSRPTPIRALASTRRCVMSPRSAIARSISSSSRCAPTISTAWRASPPQAACRSAPTRAFIRLPISSVITRARPPRV